MYDVWINLGNEVVEEVCKYFCEKVYEIIILRNICLLEVFSYGKLIIDYDLCFWGVEVY